MWTAKNRGRYDRSKLRYPSDLNQIKRTKFSAHTRGHLVMKRAQPAAF